MNFEKIRVFYVFCCIFLGLIILLPSLFTLYSFPEGEKFSEFWLLGSNQVMEGGFIDVSERESYSVSLGVTNNMNDLEFYKVIVKLRNESEPLPNTKIEIPSSLDPLFEYYFFLMNNQTWMEEFNFSFDNILSQDNILRISELTINDTDIELNKILLWNENSNGFFCQFFFELWIYNSTISGFQFHNRYVSIWLNF